jgi:Sulfatase
MNRVVGSHDLLLLVLDTLRYDVAVEQLEAGQTPTLAALLSPEAWEQRHSPGSFTYAAHQAFFAGFLPTPALPGKHPRLLSLRFEGSETTAETTCVLDGPTVVDGLRRRGYHTACVGGVGFFNKRNPLGSVLPGLFDESHWSEALGVTDPDSTANQVALATKILERQPRGRRVFLFINVSALHQPSWFYRGPDAAQQESLASHAAALAYVDSQLPPLFAALRRRGPSLCIITSDHGTAFGEQGYRGHRLAHESVWTVPYAHVVLDGAERHG